jgi:hypothetical protein
MENDGDGKEKPFCCETFSPALWRSSFSQSYFARRERESSEFFHQFERNKWQLHHRIVNFARGYVTVKNLSTSTAHIFLYHFARSVKNFFFCSLSLLYRSQCSGA